MGCLGRSPRKHTFDFTDPPERWRASSADSAQMDPEGLYPHKDLTEKIIGTAFDVHNELGSGFVEKVYENALAIELRKLGLTTEQQKPVRVDYQGASVGKFVADLVVGGTVLLEIKSAKSLTLVDCYDDYLTNVR